MSDGTDRVGTTAGVANRYGRFGLVVRNDWFERLHGFGERHTAGHRIKPGDIGGAS